MSFTSAYADIETDQVDNAHSFTNFNIRYIASKLSGKFSDEAGNMKIDRAKFANSSVDAKISPLIVNTSFAKLTMDGITKEMRLPFELLGDASDPCGAYCIGIEAHPSLKAPDCGFTWRDSWRSGR
ncbi:hypothetical protein [Candidatus Methylopumilus turicensis]|uniref:YceI n=1 Tax=Candidatus Methylopumilus turicensis TaxID=1581680 RepID=A0A0B7IUY5_9PROT